MVAQGGGTPTLTYSELNFGSGSGTKTIPESDYIIVCGFINSGDATNYSKIIKKGKSETWDIKTGVSATVSLDNNGTTVTYSGITQSGVYPSLTGFKLA